MTFIRLLVETLVMLQNVKDHTEYLKPKVARYYYTCIENECFPASIYEIKLYGTYLLTLEFKF